MRFAKSLLETFFLLLLICCAESCGKEKGESKENRTYERLTASAIRLYAEIQPLRSSALGIASSDSLLFAFSEDEIARATKRLKKLESQFSDLSASKLTPRDIDEATVVIHWLRGELFAFETLENHRHNPLLYCWTAEEALWEMPARVTPPYAGELSAYRKRILRIPPLLANARRNLANPAEAHVRYAIERLDTLTSGMGALEALIEKRYGARLDGELELVRKSLVDFRRFASDLAPASHGTLILGAENLSKLFLYDELIDTDPNVLTAEAESQIKRLLAEKSSIERRIEFERQRSLGPAPQQQPGRTAGTGEAPPRTAAGIRNVRAAISRKDAGETLDKRMEPLEAKVERLSPELWAPKEEGTGIAKRAGVRPLLAYPARVEYFSPCNKDPYLSIPPVGEPTAAAALTLPFSAPACQPYLLLLAGSAKVGDAELSYRLLSAAPEVLEPGAVRCQKKDTVGALFSSVTFEDGWRYLALTEREHDIMKNNPALVAILLDERIEQFARMIVVFRLHAGSLTSEEAVRYLVETIGMEQNAASHEVLLASIAPAVAYPGISMILIEEMLKNAAYVHGYGNPARDLASQLLESRDIPLALILPMTKSD